MTTDLTPEHTARRQGDNKGLHPEVRAAYRYVESVLDSADISSGKLGGPLWFGWALREAFLAGCSRAHIALAQPEPEERPIWTEGVCGDGAAILKDGVMQPIESVIAALNAAELAQPEPEGLTEEELEKPADDYMFMDGADGTMHLEHIDFARAAIAADRARYVRPTIEPVPDAKARELLNLLLDDLDALIDSSEGVAGLHLNGDVASWESLREGGPFEAWLMRMDEARAFLDSTMDKPEPEQP
jgi:hypothetical protein